MPRADNRLLGIGSHSIHTPQTTAHDFHLVADGRGPDSLGREGLLRVVPDFGRVVQDELFALEGGVEEPFRRNAVKKGHRARIECRRGRSLVDIGIVVNQIFANHPLRHEPFEALLAEKILQGNQIVGAQLVNRNPHHQTGGMVGRLHQGYNQQRKEECC